MNLRVKKRIPSCEIVHYYSNDGFIGSSFNKIEFDFKGFKGTITMPLSLLDKLFGTLRLLRRFFRLDKCNVLASADQFIIIRGGWVYNYDLNTNLIIKTLKLKQCKNVLHQSICSTPCGKIFFGEYGNNVERNPVNVYRSDDNGKNWIIVYSFPAGQIRHVHGCYYDPYENRIWTLTGDFNKENLILKSDLDFNDLEIIGDGSQKYRAVSIFFELEFVHWIMDSPIEDSYHFVMNRKTKEIERRSLFSGPVWYLKKLNDGIYLAGTSVEIGEGVHEKNACLYASRDLLKWECINKFEKDFLPMPQFKWGVMAFSDGEQTSESFAIHFEALKKVDGKSYIFSINEN
jgi:hypothetical protein